MYVIKRTRREWSSRKFKKILSVCDMRGLPLSYSEKKKLIGLK